MPYLALAMELRFALLRYGQTTDFLRRVSDRELALWQDRMSPWLAANTDGMRHADPSETRDRPPRFPPGTESLFTDRRFQNLLLLPAGSVDSQLGLETEVLEATDEVLARIEDARR